MTGDGYSDINRVDCLITINDFECYSAEVCIDIGELFRCQAHVGCAGICSRSCCLTIEGEVIIHIIQICVGSCRIAADSVCIAVIISSVVRTCDRDCYIDRFNNQSSGNIKRIVECTFITVFFSYIPCAVINVSICSGICALNSRRSLESKRFSGH